MISSVAREHGRHGERKPVEVEQRLLPEAAVLRLEEAMRERLEKAAEDGSLLQSMNCAMLVFHWLDFGGEEPVHAWMERQLAEDRATVRLVD